MYPSRLPLASFLARTIKPRGNGRRAYHNLIYDNTVDESGRHAAWEQPNFFSEEVELAGLVRRVYRAGTGRQAPALMSVGDASVVRSS